MMFPGEKENGLTAQPTGLSPALRAQEKKLSQENFTTVVFVHMTEEQRQELMSYVHSKWDVKDGLRVTALSADHEMTRLNLIEDALERVDDHYELREIIGNLCSHPDISAWDWEKALEDE